jgi:hypothetical protein
LAAIRPSSAAPVEEPFRDGLDHAECRGHDTKACRDDPWIGWRCGRCRWRLDDVVCGHHFFPIDRTFPDPLRPRRAGRRRSRDGAESEHPSSWVDHSTGTSRGAEGGGRVRSGEVGPEGLAGPRLSESARGAVTFPFPHPPDPPARRPAVGWVRSVGSRPAAARAGSGRDIRADRRERSDRRTSDNCRYSLCTLIIILCILIIIVSPYPYPDAWNRTAGRRIARGRPFRPRRGSKARPARKPPTAWHPAHPVRRLVRSGPIESTPRDESDRGIVPRPPAPSVGDRDPFRARSGPTSMGRLVGLTSVAASASPRRGSWGIRAWGSLPNERRPS